MALSGANRGTGGNATAATSIAVVPGNNFSSGSLAVLCIAYDNSATQGADPFTSISDNSGNTWTSRMNALNDPGAASAGSTLRIFTTTVGTLTTGTTITVSFNASTTAKAWTMYEVSSSLQNGIASYTSSSSATGSGTTQTISVSMGTVGDMVIGVLGQEGNGTRTGDSDTTNGTWSTALTTGFGTTTSGIEILSQYKVVTGTGIQTFNPTATPLGDWCIGYITVTEGIISSFDPMGMMGFFGI